MSGGAGRPGHKTTAQPAEPILRRLFETAQALPLSFELYPPRSQSGRAALRETMARLNEVATAGFSVTMGAGGKTRAGTIETACAIRSATGRPVMAHVTALGLTREEALATADRLWSAGIGRILALRGDRPRDVAGALPEGFAHASDLVTALRRQHDFDIAVAAYPEKHPEAGSLDADIDRLKEKLDAGASRALCQFVLDPEAYGRFLDACARHGVQVPVIPGVMPLENWKRIRGFARMNGATIPDWLERLLSRCAGTPGVAPMIAFAATLEQARRLVAYGAPALHVYALNRWQIPLALARMLGHPPGGESPGKPD